LLRSTPFAQVCWPCLLRPKGLFIIIHKNTVTVFRLAGSCEPPCGCWDLNSGPSEEQSVLLPVEPSHQPPRCSCFILGCFLSLASMLVRFLFCFVFVFFGFFRDRVSLCSPGCPGTHFVDQAGLELKNPPASASQVLELKACGPTWDWSEPSYGYGAVFFFFFFFFLMNDWHGRTQPTVGGATPGQGVCSWVRRQTEQAGWVGGASQEATVLHGFASVPASRFCP
jgi:hypothetical protein